MRVFVCETVTGGDYLGEEIPASLIREGTAMRDTLIGDLEDLPGVRVVTTHDARIAPPPRGTSRALRIGDDPRAIWSMMAQETDCCWPIAPETDGLLQRLVALLRSHNRRVVSPDDETLRSCASKTRTAEMLAAAGIPVVPTWRYDAVPEGLTGPFVVKPDDGAGAVGVQIHAHLPAARLPVGSIVQPLVEGEHASLSLLCQEGRAYPLTANRQHMVRADDAFRFEGLTVGAFPIDNALRALAEKVGAALPGLRGIVGFDYIATREGPVVVEVNPRLTTAYAGLRRSLGVNPVAFVAELIRDGVVPDLPHLPAAIHVEVIV